MVTSFKCKCGNTYCSTGDVLVVSGAEVEGELVWGVGEITPPFPPTAWEGEQGINK